MSLSVAFLKKPPTCVLTLVNISFHCEAHGYKILYQLKIDLSFRIALLANGELRLLIAYLYTKTIQKGEEKGKQ